MQRNSAVIAIAAGAGARHRRRVILNGSLAGRYGLALPVLVGERLPRPAARRSRSRLGHCALRLLLLVGASARSRQARGEAPIGRGRGDLGPVARRRCSSRRSRAIARFHALGSGLGSFQRVYPLYEDPRRSRPTYVIHAHNDYVELALELGVAGILLMLAVPGWWAAAVWRAWRDAEAGLCARGGDRVGGDPRPQPGRFPASHRGDQRLLRDVPRASQPTAAQGAAQRRSRI